MFLTLWPSIHFCLKLIKPFSHTYPFFDQVTERFVKVHGIELRHNLSLHRLRLTHRGPMRLSFIIKGGAKGSAKKSPN